MQHVNIDAEEMAESEAKLFESPLFQKELAKLKLPKGAVGELARSRFVSGRLPFLSQSSAIHGSMALTVLSPSRG